MRQEEQASSHEADLNLSFAVSTGNSCYVPAGKDGRQEQRDLLHRAMIIIIITAIRRASGLASMNKTIEVSMPGC